LILYKFTFLFRLLQTHNDNMECRKNCNQRSSELKLTTTYNRLFQA